MKRLKATERWPWYIGFIVFLVCLAICEFVDYWLGSTIFIIYLVISHKIEYI